MKNPIFVALDTVDLDQALALGSAVAPHVGGLKLGLEFCHACGPQGIAAVAELGLPLFLDIKLHDIPNTVAGGIRAVLPLAPMIVNIHTFGGRAMMEAAAKEAQKAGKDRPWIIGVTVLTSLDDSDLSDVGVTKSSQDQAVALAQLAKDSGLDGVVCSPMDIEAIRKECGPEFKLIVPGIRPAGAPLGDQKRVLTPSEAYQLGADVMVIGRPITQADDPAEAARAIAQSLSD